MQPSILKLTLSGLLLVAMALTACVSKPTPEPAPTAVSPTLPPEILTATQVLSLAESAARTVISYRATGETLVYVVGEDTRAGTTTFEWSAPDRSRQALQTPSSDDSGTETTELVGIEDRVYRGTSGGNRTDPNELHWQEVLADTSRANVMVVSMDLVEPLNTGLTTLYDRKVYRISGTPVSVIESIPVNGELQAAENLLFIDASDFRLLRIERKLSVGEIRPDNPAVDAEPSAVELEPTGYSSSITLDFEYFDEPLTINPPRRYFDLNSRLPVVIDDGKEVTEPVIQLPQVVTVLPGLTPFLFPTLTPDDPNQQFPPFLSETPYYDKLELGNGIVVTYPLCNSRNSLIDRGANIIIYYVQDGSRAANGAVFSRLFDGARPDEFTALSYNSSEGRTAIEAVLNDDEVMRRIDDHADVHVRCPAELLRFTGHTFKDLPDSDRLVINRSTIARFEPCGSEGESLAAQLLIAHLPSETMIAVTLVQQHAELVWSDDVRGQELLWALYDNTALMERLAAMAPREARCG